MKRVLITGVGGFIGSHLYAKLSKSGEYELCGIDSFSNYYSVSYKYLRLESLVGRSDHEPKIVDISNAYILESVFDEFRPQIVIHLAAQAGVRLPLDKFDSYIQSNLVGFANIMRLSSRFHVQDVLYASSSSVYGNSAQIPYSEHERNLLPTSFYGSTKLSNEVMSQPFAQLYGVRVRGLRFFTVYGPWGRPDMAYFRILAGLMTGKPFSLLGDGTVQRDFTFIDDVISLVERLLVDLSNKEQGYCDVVNVGGGNPYSILQIIEKLEQISNRRLSVISSPQDKSDIELTKSSSDYRDQLIGVHKFIPLEKGLEHFVDWGRGSKILGLLGEWVESSR